MIDRWSQWFVWPNSSISTWDVVSELPTCLGAHPLLPREFLPFCSQGGGCGERGREVWIKPLQRGKVGHVGGGWEVKMHVKEGGGRVCGHGAVILPFLDMDTLPLHYTICLQPFTRTIPFTKYNLHEQPYIQTYIVLMWLFIYLYTTHIYIIHNKTKFNFLLFKTLRYQRICTLLLYAHMNVTQSLGKNIFSFSDDGWKEKLKTVSEYFHRG